MRKTRIQRQLLVDARLHLEQQPECLPSNQYNPARNLLGPSGLNQLCERGWLLLGSAPVSNSPILPEHEHLQPNHMRQRSKCKQLRCSWLALSDDDFLHESTLCALSVPDCLPNGTGLLLDRVHTHRPELHRVHVCMRELFSGPLAERVLVVPRTHGPIVHSEREPLPSLELHPSLQLLESRCRALWVRWRHKAGAGRFIRSCCLHQWWW